MVNSMKELRLITLLLFFCFSSANAYKINPMNRSFSSTQDDHITNMISEPVHERITLDALNLYQAKCSTTMMDNKNCLLDLNDVSVKFNPLIRGNWWSDDPNQLLYKAKQIAWVTQLKDAERRAKNKKYTIDGTYKMMYRTHYGDMQFMHSMASKDNEQPEATVSNILMWLNFLYLISIDDLDRSTKFKDVNIIGLNTFFKRQADSKLEWILQPNYRLSRPDDFKLHALGAMLHTVQDSYSNSHTERDYESSEKCPNGKVVKFLSYTHQNPDHHGQEDSNFSYTKSLIHKNNSLNASEQLIEFSMRKANWDDEVLPYLTNIVFCLDNPELSGPGKF